MCVLPPPPSNKLKGFTLVELSIVIVIIGLIISGVTAGQSLIKSSQLRSVITDVQSFQAAINAFKMQYNSLPGDIANASSYWTCPNNNSDNLNCNGNGNRVIEFSAGGNGGGTNNSETFRFWQHLKLAGLTPNAVSGTGNSYTTANSPASRIPHSLYFVQYHATAFFQHPGFALGLGSDTASIWNGVTGLTPVMAKSIDDKMDDGVANKGKMFGESTGGGGNVCSAGGNTAGADYNLQGAGPCILVWWIF